MRYCISKMIVSLLLLLFNVTAMAQMFSCPSTAVNFVKKAGTYWGWSWDLDPTAKKYFSPYIRDTPRWLGLASPSESSFSPNASLIVHISCIHKEDGLRGLVGFYLADVRCLYYQKPEKVEDDQYGNQADEEISYVLPILPDELYKKVSSSWIDISFNKYSRTEITEEYSCTTTTDNPSQCEIPIRT